MKAAPQLYLDTARLGCMKPSAELAVRDFARLASRGDADLYGVQFLKDGFRSVDRRIRDRYPGIRNWAGTARLQNSLRHFANAPEQCSCILSSRSLNLMRLATKAMRRRCRRVLILDLCWEPFQLIAQRAFRRANIVADTLRLRSDTLTSGINAREVTEAVATEFLIRDCDGIILPAVSHDGIRLPVDTILEEIKALRPETFAIVDGAQAFAHVSTNIGINKSDVFLCGAHKWLGAGMPLGIAFVSDEVASFYRASPINDPLGKFVEGLGHGTETGTETVNVWPLFACHGALHEAGDATLIENSLKERRWNSANIRASLSNTSWEVRKLDASLSSGIEVLSPRRFARNDDHCVLQSRLSQRGVTATTYRGPTIRLSMPGTALSGQEIAKITSALAS